MSLTKKIVVPGNGKDTAKAGDTAYFSYSIFLYDENEGSNGFKGDR